VGVARSWMALEPDQHADPRSVIAIGERIARAFARETGKLSRRLTKRSVITLMPPSPAWLTGQDCSASSRESGTAAGRSSGR